MKEFKKRDKSFIENGRRMIRSSKNLLKVSIVFFIIFIIFVMYNHPLMKTIVSKRVRFSAKNWGFLCAHYCVLLFNHLYHFPHQQNHILRE